MDLERLRRFINTLPHTEETVQWGDNLVFWAGDKSVGGKMFLMAELGDTRRHVAAFAAGEEGSAELLEREGVFPAPYLARAHWVALERWDVLADSEWRQQVAAAYERVFARLPRRTRDALALPARQRQSVLKQRKQAHAKSGKAKN